LDLLEAGLLNDLPIIKNPVEEFKLISKDIKLSHKITAIDGSKITALEIQNILYKKAAEFYGNNNLPEINEGLLMWKEILIGLDYWQKKMSENSNLPIIPFLIKNVEWIGLAITANQLLKKKENQEQNFNIARYLQKLDLSYRNILDNTSLYNWMEEKINLRKITNPTEIKEAALTAPKNTRAWLASEIIKKFKDKIVSAH